MKCGALHIYIYICMGTHMYITHNIIYIYIYTHILSKGSSRNRMHIIACIAKIQPPITYWLKCDVKRFWGASDGSSLITGCTAPRHNGIDIQNKD